MGKLAVSENDLFTNEGLLDAITRAIAQELAAAVESNSVNRIKELKNKYGGLKEFVTAKNFLNQKCKEVWNVFEQNKTNAPHEAMKTLGITNQPTLDFLLGDSMRYFEKSNGEMTVRIIKSILSNSNMSYTVGDIHKYLVEIYKKDGCKCNTKTAQYLIFEHNYNKQKLLEIGLVDTDILKNTTPALKTKYAYENIKQQLSAVRNFLH